MVYLSAFHSIARDAVGNTETKGADSNEAGTFSGHAATATAVTPGGTTVTYGESAPLTATVSSAYGSPTDGSVQFLVDGVAFGGTVLVSSKGTAQLANTLPVGSHPVAAEYLGDANFTATLSAAETGASLLVTPAASIVTADPEIKSYGSADPTLTYTIDGLQLGDTAATALTGSLSRAAGETVAGGPYAITRGTLAADSNSKIVNFLGDGLTITPATPTIAIHNASATYGTATTTLGGHLAAGFQVPPAGETVSVTINGATQTGLLNGSGDFSIAFATGALGVAGSPCAVTYHYAGDGNLNSASDSCTALIVTPALLTPVVTVSNKVYDGTSPAGITGETLVGVIGTDRVGLTGGTATFDDADPGTGKTVTVTGLSLTGLYGALGIDDLGEEVWNLSTLGVRLRGDSRNPWCHPWCHWQRTRDPPSANQYAHGN